MSGAFWAAYAGSCVAQGVLVALPRPAPASLAQAARHPAFALVLPLSLVTMVVGLWAWPAAVNVVADVSLAALPVLAIAAALAYGRRALAATLALIPLVLLADGVVRQIAVLCLLGASTLALGRLLATLTPPGWLRVGIAVMAVVDIALIAFGFYAPVAAELYAVHLPDGLPSLQQVQLGPMTMGYADLFLPALVGALLAHRAGSQRRVAVGTTAFGLLCAPLLLLGHPFPATVPVAAALVADDWRCARARSAGGAVRARAALAVE